MTIVENPVMRATWSPLGVALLLLVLLCPIYLPLLPVFEGAVAPVTGKVTFIDVEPVEGQGLSVRMAYEKRRDCEYLGVSADVHGDPVAFEPISGGIPKTLPTGQRVSRPWLLGVDSIDGVRLRWVHRCNPYWTTVTQGFP